MNAFCKLRTLAGLTQHEVAALVGVTTNAVSAWERGISSPRAGLWAALSRAFGVSVATVAKAVERNSQREETYVL